MPEDYEILVGDKVDVIMDSDRACRTMIEDNIGNGLFLAGVPRYGGVQVRLREDEVIPVMFYRESGRYVVSMKVIGFEKRGEIHYVWLFQSSVPHRVQRRAGYRVPVRIKVHLNKYIGSVDELMQESGDTAGAHAPDIADSLDISVTGIAITSRKTYTPGEKYQLKLHFDDEQREKTPPFILFAEVVRTLQGRNKGMQKVGMKFFGLTKSMDEFLARFVLVRQQQMLMQKRLVDKEYD